MRRTRQLVAPFDVLHVEKLIVDGGRLHQEIYPASRAVRQTQSMTDLVGVDQGSRSAGKQVLDETHIEQVETSDSRVAAKYDVAGAEDVKIAGRQLLVLAHLRDGEDLLGVVEIADR